MSRKKLFIENIFAYGFISVINKMVPFLLLPIVTRMLPNASDYGIYNMFTLVIGFGTPLAVMGIYDAMFREYYEEDDEQYKYDVTVTGQRIVLVASIIISALCIIFSKEIAQLFFGEAKYKNVVIFSGVGVLFSANKSPAQVPSRMENKKKIFLFSGLISSLTIYGVAWLLLKNGYSYYSLIYSSINAEIFLLIYFIYNNRSYFKRGRFQKKIARELVLVGLPLLPTFLIYWVYNSIDKLMITNMLGTVDLGVYSIGAKIAQISQLIYTGFAGGFAYFKYKTMNDHDQIVMNSRLFEYLGVISFASFALVLPLAKIVFSILFEGEYVGGYIVMPYLFLSPLLLMLFQVVGTQFIIVKKSYISSVTLLVGALFNILLNFYLIRTIGVEGASIATLTGYTISVIATTMLASKMKLLIMSKKLIIMFSTTVIYAIVYRLLLTGSLLSSFLLFSAYSLILLFTYHNETKSILLKIVALKNKGR